MTSKKLYVDFHVLQTVPPSCVNRDDTGRPKTAIYGGAVRARVSSQAWKHAIREMFRNEIFDETQLGFRTKYITDLIAKKLVASGENPEKALKKASEAIANAGVKVTEKKGVYTTGALFFISSKQVDKLAELIINGEKNKDAYKSALNELPSIDIALFGRMVADDVKLNVDAACQVSHAISTHAVQNEYDYFTAVDDCSPADNAGAGHLGTLEFNSSTLYRYATINVNELYKSIGEDTPDAVCGFADAFIRSIPTGKQNSYANGTLPDLIYITIRTDQPVNLCGAFEKPVRGHEGFVSESKKALAEYARTIYSDYCNKPEHAFIIGNVSDSETIGAERKNFKEMLETLKKIIADEVSA